MGAGKSLLGRYIGRDWQDRVVPACGAIQYLAWYDKVGVGVGVDVDVDVGGRCGGTLGVGVGVGVAVCVLGVFVI